MKCSITFRARRV